MGWPKWKVGVEYDGPQHWATAADHARTIERIADLEAELERVTEGLAAPAEVAPALLEDIDTLPGRPPTEVEIVTNLGTRHAVIESELLELLQKLNVERNLSPNTIDAYGRDLKQLVEVLVEAGVDGDVTTIDHHHLSLFLKAQRDAQINPRTIARKTSAARGCSLPCMNAMIEPARYSRHATMIDATAAQVSLYARSGGSSQSSPKLSSRWRDPMPPVR